MYIFSEMRDRLRSILLFTIGFFCLIGGMISLSLHEISVEVLNSQNIARYIFLVFSIIIFFLGFQNYSSAISKKRIIEEVNDIPTN